MPLLQVKHSAAGQAKVGLYALLDKYRTDWTVLHDQTLRKSYAESSADNLGSDAQAVCNESKLTVPESKLR